MNKRKPTQTDILHYVTIQEVKGNQNNHIFISFTYKESKLTFVLQHIEGDEYEPFKVIHGDQNHRYFCQCCEEFVRKGTRCNGFTMVVNEKELNTIIEKAITVDNQIYAENNEELLGKNHINGMDKQNVHALMAKFYEYAEHT